MVHSNVVTKDYTINGFKNLSDLAVEYFPTLSTPSAASRKMRAQIKANKSLNEEMATVYYTAQTIDISPEMQLLLYRYWGPPKIHLPTDIDLVRSDENKNKQNTEKR